MDEADRAQQVEEAARAAAIAMAVSGDDSMTDAQDGICDDCGNDIEPGRLAAKANARRCLECQEAHERHQAQYRRRS